MVHYAHPLANTPNGTIVAETSDAETLLRALVETDGILVLVIITAICLFWGRDRLLRMLDDSLAPSSSVAAPTYGSFDLPIASLTGITYAEDDDIEDDDAKEPLHSMALRQPRQACYGPTASAQAVVVLAYVTLGLLAAATHLRAVERAPGCRGSLCAMRYLVTTLVCVGYDTMTDQAMPSFEWWCANGVLLSLMLACALYSIADADPYDVRLPMLAAACFLCGTPATSLLVDAPFTVDAAVAATMGVAGFCLAAVQGQSLLRALVASFVVALLMLQTQRLFRQHDDLRPSSLAVMIAPIVALLAAGYAAAFERHAVAAALNGEPLVVVALDVSFGSALDLARLAVLASASALTAAMMDATKDAARAILLAVLPGAVQVPGETHWLCLGVLLLAQLAWVLNILLLKAYPKLRLKRGTVVHFGGCATDASSQQHDEAPLHRDSQPCAIFPL